MSFLEAGLPTHYMSPDGGGGTGSHVPSPEELQNAYPDLARARELYIQLLNRPQLFSALGYTHDQEFWARIVTDFIDEDMRLVPHKKYPFLESTRIDLDDETDGDNPEAARIYRINNSGFGVTQLMATYDDMADIDYRNMGPEQQILARIFHQRPRALQIFDETSQEVVNIGLFDPSAPTDDLSFLIKSLIEPHEFHTLHAQGRVTKAIGKILPVATYQARWLDEERKDSFAVRIEIPWGAKPVVEDSIFQRLTDVEDNEGVQIPIGRKANTSSVKVTQILSEAKGLVVSGQLATQRSRG